MTVIVLEKHLDIEFHAGILSSFLMLLLFSHSGHVSVEKGVGDGLPYAGSLGFEFVLSAA
jgi:hypothetical protein